MTEAPTRPDWLPEHLYPFESRRRSAGGCDFHYVDEGAGRPILFLHGNPTWSFLYRNVVLGLRDSFRCIAVDLPGFGLSSAPEGYGFTPAEHADALEQLVDDLGLDDVTLMAQDWGGPIGLTVATRHPEGFSGLVLGNTWAWRLNGTLHFEAFSRAFGNPLGRLLIGGANAFVNLTIPLGTATRLPAEVMRAYRAPLATFASRRPTWELPRELLRSKPFLARLEEDLPTITHLPALFVWGGDDFALRKGVELPRLEALFFDHETVVLDGAKHFFQEDAPDRVVTEIRRWMEARG
ncbi:MAG TPA: alpha/beta fold hydrolase [Actinomycetota bacterium]|nr:alpha/beta fold hydrolase [Actinomycetota bacterium]